MKAFVTTEEKPKSGKFMLPYCILDLIRTTSLDHSIQIQFMVTEFCCVAMVT